MFTPGPSAPYNQCGPYGGCAYDYQAPKLVVEGQLSYTCKCPAPTLYWNGKECLRGSFPQQTRVLVCVSTCLLAWPSRRLAHLVRASEVTLCRY